MNKRIIFLNRYFFPDHSATSQMLSDLAFGLASRQHNVTVITSRQRYDDPDARLPKSEQIEGVKIVRVATPRFGRASIIGRLFDYLGFYITATFALARNARRNDVIVAKTDPPLISVPAAVICSMRGATLVNWLQDLFPEVAQALDVKGFSGVIGNIARILRNWSLRKASLNVVIGQRMQQRLLDLKVPSEKISIINNWADTTEITPIDPADNPLRHEWELDNVFVVGYSGNFGRAHEIETLLGAMRLLKDREDIRLSLIHI